MSSMASEYGPSRTRHVCHMSVDQHNVGSGGGPRMTESLHHRPRSPVPVRNVALSTARSSETVRPFTWVSSEPSDPIWCMKTFVKMMRRVHGALPIAIGHDWTHWSNWHQTKWKIDALGSKPLSEHLCLRWCPDIWELSYMFVARISGCTTDSLSDVENLIREPDAMWNDKKFVRALRRVCGRESR
jgi:hypothetical protein